MACPSRKIALLKVCLFIFLVCNNSCCSFSHASAQLTSMRAAYSKLRLPIRSDRLGANISRRMSQTDDSSSPRVPFGSRFKTNVQKRWQYTLANFKENPMQYLTIPVVAAIVGYVTNYLGVSMLFYPVQWRGIPIKRWAQQPFGLIGWQGVVPAKRVQMANTMVDVTISRLLKISEVFAKLDPRTMAVILSSTVKDVVFGGIVPAPVLNFYLRRVAADVIRSIEGIVDIKDLVVKGMTSDARILGDFFQRVGSKELSFLVSSGTYFGFLLGLLQMVQWMIYPANWTLPVGGAVVGYVTNWIALKWIFEPLYPTKVGPFVLQGLFLRRQREVSQEFSAYISDKVLNSQEVWNSILNTPSSQQKFAKIVSRNVPFMGGAHLAGVIARLQATVTTSTAAAKSTVVSAASTSSGVLSGVLQQSGINKAAASGQLLHRYTNQRLGLKELLTERMNRLTPAEFEQVLHPIFQEDEIILIAAGGVLGCIAGGLQWWLNVALEKRKHRKQQQQLQQLQQLQQVQADTTAGGAVPATQPPTILPATIQSSRDIDVGSDSGGITGDTETNTSSNSNNNDNDGVLDGYDKDMTSNCEEKDVEEHSADITATS